MFNFITFLVHTLIKIDKFLLTQQILYRNIVKQFNNKHCAMERIIWLYSEATSGWWCYDDENNIKINKMYLEFCKNKMKVNASWKKEKIEKINLKQHIIQIKQIDNDTNDLVDFSDINSENTNEQDDISLNSDSTTISEQNENEEIINNIIKTGGGKYKIDFNNMMQINHYDIKKRTFIMFLKIPENIFNNPTTLKKFLIDNKVKGVTGINFN